MSTKRELVLAALFARLQTISGPTVLRSADKPEEIPENGLVVMYDGAMGEPVETYLSPLTYLYDHEVPVELIVAAETFELRTAALEALLAALGTVLAADRTLGGLCDEVRETEPEVDALSEEGAETEHGAVVRIICEYATSSPLA